MSKQKRWQWVCIFLIGAFLLTGCGAAQPEPTLAPTLPATAAPTQTSTPLPTQAPTQAPALSNWNEIPIMPDAFNGTEDMGDYQFSVNASWEEIIDFYALTMLEQEWDLRADMMTSIPTDLAYQKGTLFVFFKIVPNGGNNDVWIHRVEQ